MGDGGGRDDPPAAVLRATSGQAAVLVELTELAAGRDVPAWELLETGADRLARCLGDPCIASLLSDDGAWLHPLGLADPDPAVKAELESCAGARVLADRGFARQVLATSQSLRLPETSSDVIRAGRPELAFFVHRYAVHGLVVAPMRAHGRCIGHVAALRFRDTGRYTDQDEQLVQVVADLLALGIGGPASPGKAPRRQDETACEELTGREREVLALLAEGHTNREIAERLVLSVRTVEWHRGRLHWKLGVSGRAALIAKARAGGLIEQG